MLGKNFQPAFVHCMKLPNFKKCMFKAMKRDSKYFGLHREEPIGERLR